MHNICTLRIQVVLTLLKLLECGCLFFAGCLWWWCFRWWRFLWRCLNIGHIFWACNVWCDDPLITDIRMYSEALFHRYIEFWLHWILNIFIIIHGDTLIISKCVIVLLNRHYRFLTGLLKRRNWVSLLFLSVWALIQLISIATFLHRHIPLLLLADSSGTC